jgi:hypothetical protein
MAREVAAVDIFMRCAAAVKLPSSATRANIRMLLSVSTFYVL